MQGGSDLGWLSAQEYRVVLRGVLGPPPLGCLGPNSDPATAGRARSSRGFSLTTCPGPPRRTRCGLPGDRADELRVSFHGDGAATQAPEEEA